MEKKERWLWFFKSPVRGGHNNNGGGHNRESPPLDLHLHNQKQQSLIRIQTSDVWKTKSLFLMLAPKSHMQPTPGMRVGLLALGLGGKGWVATATTKAETDSMETGSLQTDTCV